MAAIKKTNDSRMNQQKVPLKISVLAKKMFEKSFSAVNYIGGVREDSQKSFERAPKDHKFHQIP